ALRGDRLVRARRMAWPVVAARGGPPPSRPYFREIPMLKWFTRLARPRRLPASTFRPALEALEDRRLLAGNVLQTNLVSDLPGVAANLDPHLVNPWGISESSTSFLWV